MGLFDRLFHRGPKRTQYVMGLDGYTPIFSQFGNDIYASDVVQQALRCIVDEIKKLRPMHVRYEGSDPVPVDSDLEKVLLSPNDLMTTTEFLEKTCWLLLLNDNAFVMPVYDVWRDPESGEERRRYRALYPIKPDMVEFIQDETGRLFVKFYFAGGDASVVPYDDVIHIRLNYGLNDFMGGDMSGRPDHGPLLETLRLNKTLLDGIAKAMKASYAVNGVVRYNTIIDDGTTMEQVKLLEKKLAASESGILPLDLKAEFTPLERKAQIVDADALKFLDEKILRTFGVPLDILTGDYTKAQYEAFYQKTLEPLIVAFSQAFTKKVFTEREKSYGNRIEFYPKALIFMSIDQTLEMVNLLSQTGAMYENEKRVALGLPPLPELEGMRFMSLNWINSNDATRYQVEDTGQAEDTGQNANA